MIRNTIISLGGGSQNGVVLTSQITISIIPNDDGTDVRSITYQLVSSPGADGFTGEVPSRISQMIRSTFDKSLVEDLIWIDTPHLKLLDILRAICSLSTPTEQDLENRAMFYNVTSTYKSYEELAINLLLVDISVYLVLNHCVISHHLPVPHFPPITKLTSDFLTRSYIEMMGMSYQIWCLSHTPLISLIGTTLLTFCRNSSHLFHNDFIKQPHIDINRLVVAAATTSVDKINFMISCHNLQHQQAMDDIQKENKLLHDRVDRMEKLLVRLSSK